MLVLSVQSCLAAVVAVFLVTTATANDPPREVIPPPGVTEVSALAQNWSADDAQWFYSVPQGSKLLPYQWFLHIEQADAVRLFRDADHIHQLGYIPRTPETTRNPDALPVGFTKDGEHLGLTCAACHTAIITRSGRGWLVDGAPTQGDFEEFLRRLVKAMEATRDDVGKWDRFAENVLGAGAGADAKAKLKEAFGRELAARKGYNERNLPASGSTRFGPGRADAFGAIMNQVAVVIAGVPDNARSADAPVSYPFLWDTPQHDFVQWNGAAPNRKTTNSLLEKVVGTKHIGALGRNAGEVLGVFGTMDASEEGPIVQFRGYPSSINRNNLIAIEDSLRRLWSPQWPDQLGAIDQNRKAQGEELFRQNCAECHQPIDRMSEARSVTAMLVAVGTDPTMATNFKTREAKTGHLNGRVASLDRFPFQKFGERSPVALMLRHVVRRGILQPSPDLLAEIKAHKLKTLQALREFDDLIDYQLVGQVNTDLGPQLERASFPPASAAGGLEGPQATAEVVYKARPLNGIWATAPYLHNGSVPNLDELLKPANERSAVPFKVGGREFDPVKVGFVPGTVEFDPRLKGNRNTGHDFGRHKRPGDEPTKHTGEEFTEAERAALIEYLKSL